MLCFCQWLNYSEHDDNTTEEQDNKILALADRQISAFGWDETFKSWKKYLVEKIMKK